MDGRDAVGVKSVSRLMLAERGWSIMNSDNAYTVAGTSPPTKKKIGRPNRSSKSPRASARTKAIVAMRDEFVARQSGKCSICARSFRDKCIPNLDHSYATGRTRAALCNRCNTGLGCFDDNPALLEQAITYLRSDYSGNPMYPAAETAVSRVDGSQMIIGSL